MGRIGGDFADAMDQSLGRAEEQPALGLDDADRAAASVEDRTFGGRADALRTDLEPIEFVAQNRFDAGAAAKGMKADAVCRFAQRIRLSGPLSLGHAPPSAP